LALEPIAFFSLLAFRTGKDFRLRRRARAFYFYLKKTIHHRGHRGNFR
jgi:uncharacterized membrane protein